MSEPIRRVLVVDDDPVFCEFLELLLSSEGYHVESAATVDDALARVTAARPDVVIGDVRLPDSPPFALVRRLRGNPATATLPVLLCTGAVQETEALTERDLDAATALIHKPFDINDLLDCVARLLRAG